MACGHVPHQRFFHLVEPAVTGKMFLSEPGLTRKIEKPVDAVPVRDESLIQKINVFRTVLPCAQVGYLLLDFLQTALPIHGVHDPGAAKPAQEGAPSSRDNGSDPVSFQGHLFQNRNQACRDNWPGSSRRVGHHTVSVVPGKPVNMTVIFLAAQNGFHEFRQEFLSVSNSDGIDKRKSIQDRFRYDGCPDPAQNDLFSWVFPLEPLGQEKHVRQGVRITTEGDNTGRVMEGCFQGIHIDEAVWRFQLKIPQIHPKSLLAQRGRQNDGGHGKPQAGRVQDKIDQGDIRVMSHGTNLMTICSC